MDKSAKIPAKKTSFADGIPACYINTVKLSITDTSYNRVPPIIRQIFKIQPFRRPLITLSYQRTPPVTEQKYCGGECQVMISLTVLFMRATKLLVGSRWRPIQQLSVFWLFIMNILTPKERLQIVQFDLENNSYVRNLFRELRPGSVSNHFMANPISAKN